MNVCDFERYFLSRKTRYNQKIGIEEFMKSEFSDYRDFIQISHELNPYLSLIQDECNNLLSIIDEYKKGKIYNAYEKFYKSIEQLRQHLSSIIIDNTTPDKFINKSFYRMRKSETSIQSSEEMFHIPLSKRNKVKAQRYSIPGCPCLYLSSSVYTCWSEMNQPPIHELYVSRFVIDMNTKMKILNFTLIDPRRIFFKVSLPDFVEFKCNYNIMLDDQGKIDALILWPLLFSCSLSGSNEDDYFKPEYIIPQLLLQWATEKEIVDGISYLATDTNIEIIDPLWCINYVFPVKKYKNDLCPVLLKQFKLTAPERCDTIENIMKGYSGEGRELKCQKFYPGKRYADIKYEDTIYGIIEKYLERLEPEFIKMKK